MNAALYEYHFTVNLTNFAGDLEKRKNFCVMVDIHCCKIYSIIYLLFILIMCILFFF